MLGISSALSQNSSVPCLGMAGSRKGIVASPPRMCPPSIRKPRPNRPPLESESLAFISNFTGGWSWSKSAVKIVSASAATCLVSTSSAL